MNELILYNDSNIPNPLNESQLYNTLTYLNDKRIIDYCNA